MHVKFDFVCQNSEVQKQVVLIFANYVLQSHIEVPVGDDGFELPDGLVGVVQWQRVWYAEGENARFFGIQSAPSDYQSTATPAPVVMSFVPLTTAETTTVAETTTAEPTTVETTTAEVTTAETTTVAETTTAGEPEPAAEVTSDSEISGDSGSTLEQPAE